MVFEKVSSRQIRNDLQLGQHTLHICVLEGPLEDLRALLAAPTTANLHRHSPWGTALDITVWTGRLPAVEVILQSGVDPFATEPLYDPDWTPLTLAAALGHQHILELLLRYAHIDDVVRDEESSDPCCLIRAATFGQLPIMMHLLDWHASWPQVILEKCLMSAAMMWHPHVVRLLLTQTTYKQSFLEQALFHAIDDTSRVRQKGFKELPLDASAFIDQQEAITLLISVGADPNSTPWDRGQLVPRAATTLNWTAALRTLLEKGADPNGIVPPGVTALHMLGQPIIAYGSRPERILHETGIRHLLEYGASVTKQGPLGDTPLHTAAYGSRPNIFGLYLASCCATRAEEDTLLKTTVNKNTVGDTLLHFSAAGANVEMTEFLLGRGLDVNVRNEDGWSPLICALLPAHRGYFSTTNDQTLDRVVRVARLLLAHGADPTVITEEGWTSLHCLASHYDDGYDELGKELAETLLSRGVNVYALAPLVTEGRHPWRYVQSKPTEEEARQGHMTSPGRGILYWAARYGALGVVQALVAHGIAYAPLESAEYSPARIATDSINSFHNPKVGEEICELLLTVGYGY